jgi:acetolactate synthase I/III small subunit
VNCLYVDDITEKASVDRVLALVKVNVGADKRAEVLQMGEVFRARAVDVAPESLVLEISGTPDKVENLVKLLAPYGIAELVQTGIISMTRGQYTRTQGPPTLIA